MIFKYSVLMAMLPVNAGLLSIKFYLKKEAVAVKRKVFWHTEVSEVNRPCTLQIG